MQGSVLLHFFSYFISISPNFISLLIKRQQDITGTIADFLQSINLRSMVAKPKGFSYPLLNVITTYSRQACLHTWSSGISYTILVFYRPIIACAWVLSILTVAIEKRVNGSRDHTSFLKMRDIRYLGISQSFTVTVSGISFPKYNLSYKIIISDCIIKIISKRKQSPQNHMILNNNILKNILQVQFIKEAIFYIINISNIFKQSIINMTVGQKIRKLDIFKKVPKDLSEGTNVGGCISICTTLLICFLLFTEIKNYLNPNMVASIRQDQLVTRRQMTVNIDIEFPRFPCQLVSLDLMDVMLSHSANIGSIKKYRLNADGQRLQSSDFELLRERDHHKQYETAKHAFENRYGCRLLGSFTVKQVPGNFHISSHAYGQLYSRLMMQGVIKSLDVSHIIHELYFGEISNIKSIEQKHKQSVLVPLRNRRLHHDNSNGEKYTSHYHLDIVPTIYQENFYTFIRAYQYTFSHTTFNANHMPVVYFNYHIGGLTVWIQPKTVGVFSFLINLCAIIGGTYTLANFMDNLLHRFIQRKNHYTLIQ